MDNGASWTTDCYMPLLTQVPLPLLPPQANGGAPIIPFSGAFENEVCVRTVCLSPQHPLHPTHCLWCVLVLGVHHCCVMSHMSHIPVSRMSMLL